MEKKGFFSLLVIAAYLALPGCTSKMNVLTGTPNVTVLNNEHDYINSTGGYANTALSWRSDRAGDFKIVTNTVCDSSARAIADSSGTISAGQSVTTLISAGSLELGVNQLRVCVTDKINGKIGEATYSITRSDNAPIITLTPGYFAYLSSAGGGANATSTLTWQSNLAVSYQIKLNGSCASAAPLSTGANATGTLAANTAVVSTILVADLAAGANTIRICVTDTVTAAIQDLAITITRNDTAATVTAMTPGNALEAARSTSITVTFGKEVDATTVTNSTTAACTGSIRVSLDNFATCVAMTSATPAIAGNTATLTPAAKLIWGSVYKIRVTGTVKALTGEFFTTTTQATGFAVKGNVTTFAGCAAPTSPCPTGAVDATGNAASFNSPQFLAFDPSGDMYVADLSNFKIRKVTSGGVVTTFAGSGVGGATDATGIAATFNLPSGVAVDAAGNVSIADWANQKIRLISPAGVVTTLAGCAGACATGGADGIGAAASFNGPQGNAVDSAGNIFVAEGTANKIRKVTPAGVVTTFAGCAAPTSPCATGSADGTGAAASFSTPTAIAIDSADNLYVADSANNKIRKITPGAVVSTLAGSGAAGSADGTGAAATFNAPVAVAVDGGGNVYVVDASNRMIRRITPAGAVTTVAGAGIMGGADGIGSAASFWFPYGIAIDAAGDLYMADYLNNKIRKID